MRRDLWLGIGAAGLAAYGAWRALRGRSGPPPPPPDAPRVVILGAGFAGLAAARRLGRRLPGRARITLVDRHNYHLFTPLLFQVASCALDPHDVALPVRQVLDCPGVAFRKGTVLGLDLTARRVALDDGSLGYDYLIVALGTTTNFFHNQQAEQHALPLKWLEDGVAIRGRVIDALEQATRTADPAERRALLTFIVVGGGATGVEMAASLASTLRRVVPREYSRLDPRELRVLVIESEGKLAGHLGDQMARTALRRLRGQGVEVWLHTRAQGVTPNGVTTEDGRTAPARTVIWATGVRAPEVVAAAQAPHGKGESLVVDEYLRLTGHPEVYAAGDDAHVEDPETHQSVPLLAQAALQAGAAAAENLARAIEGRAPTPFRYRSLGNAISLGRRSGAVEVGGVVVDGFLGGLGCLLILLYRMPGLRNKLATALDWAFDSFQQPDTARLDLTPLPTPADVQGTLRGR